MAKGKGKPDQRVKPNVLAEVGEPQIDVVSKDAPTIERTDESGLNHMSTKPDGIPIHIQKRGNVISQEEAKKLGVLSWYRYRKDQELMTCVVNNGERRLFLKMNDFQALKDSGYAVQV